ncbi:23S rRNA (pseudouridine(1915)-N(3))-methyltransferase RlmH [candidate division KSB1 bacterium]|nr:23S rRNA (pseudouridine(1915)-N(3))-methyltransferase RlmH [candidate division KSB1 bacterium]
MKIRLFVVGKTKVSYLQEAEKDFLGRIRRFCDIDIVILKEEKLTRHRNRREIQQADARRISEKLPAGYQNIVLAVDGTRLTSEQFADFMHSLAQRGIDKLAFIIGGPVGLPDDLFENSARRLSLSRMTFTHEMCRSILLEQIYRAFTILRNEKYHK